MAKAPPNLTPTQARTIAGLLEAYRRGCFPMAPSRRARRVSLYTADPRAVVPIREGEAGNVRFSRSLRAAARRARPVITCDADFEGVIRACADAPREGGWINPWIIDAYTLLHRAGHAHSLEAWADQPGGELVGGLYGVHIGGAFFGESMFCRPQRGGTNASKVCFVRLVEHLRARDVVLLDTQFINPHTHSLGAVEVPLQEYLERLARALPLERTWGALTNAEVSA